VCCTLVGQEVYHGPCEFGTAEKERYSECVGNNVT
jgi:hypothetical protein